MARIRRPNKSELHEIERIQNEDCHGGRLRPEAIVAAAKNPTNPLHNRFQWDDSAAAELYRLQQAHDLIRIVVTVIERPGPKEENIVIRQYHSLPSARANGGGYEKINVIMMNPDKRAELVETALAEYQALEKRYHMLKELAEIFSAVKRTARRVQPKKKR